MNPLDDGDDVVLMAAVGRGDERAYAALVERHLRWALRFVERLVGSRADAEDLAQVAFLRLWQGASAWQPSARFSTWFYRVLYNLCMDHFRARTRDAATEGPDEDIADEAPSHEERIAAVQRADRVKAALAMLPERQRAALVLCYYEELSQAESAAMMGISEGALESLLSRGRTTMKKHMQQELH
jgi:RNA polymerase sigma-70 factor (ECF subfamily)